MVHKFSKKCRRHLEILSAILLTLRRCRTLRAIVQNLVATAYWHPGFVVSRCNIQISVPSDIRNIACPGYKAVPLQAWTGPEDSRMLRFPDFQTIGK